MQSRSISYFWSILILQPAGGWGSLLLISTWHVPLIWWSRKVGAWGLLICFATCSGGVLLSCISRIWDRRSLCQYPEIGLHIFVTSCAFLDVHFVHVIRFSKCLSRFESSRIKCIQVFSITLMTLYTFTCKCLVTCSTDFVYIFCLYSLLALSPEDVLPAIYLATNGIAPGFENTVSLSWHICWRSFLPGTVVFLKPCVSGWFENELSLDCYVACLTCGSFIFALNCLKDLNIGGSTVAAAISDATGTQRAKLREMYNIMGDLGRLQIYFFFIKKKKGSDDIHVRRRYAALSSLCFLCISTCYRFQDSSYFSTPSWKFVPKQREVNRSFCGL